MSCKARSGGVRNVGVQRDSRAVVLFPYDLVDQNESAVYKYV